MTSIREYTLKKYFATLTIANKHWTDEQRMKFSASMFNAFGAEEVNGYDNLFTFERKGYAKEEVFRFIQEYVGIALQAAGIIAADYYLNLSNTRGYNIHITV